MPAACLVVAGLLSCRSRLEQKTQPRTRPPLAVTAPAVVLPMPDTGMRACTEQLRAARPRMTLPGVPALDAERPRIFARAKAEPVLFVRPPRPEPSEDAWVRGYRRELERAKYPWGTLAAMLPTLTADRRRARLVLLREGYVFASEPELAFALSEQLRLDHLFRGEAVWVQRGESVLHAGLDEHGRYVWRDGSERGKTARLLLFDRVGAEEETIPVPLHRDLRHLRNRLHFDEMRPLRFGEDALEADLRYGTSWIRTLFRTAGSRVELACEVASVAEAAMLAAHREQAARQLRVVQALREVIREEVDEQVPFDEPETEYGQQDGKLRPRWQAALLGGASTFTFNGDKYPVFDDYGRPLAPQVCFDFLMDSLERMSGTRWLRRDEGRGRRLGRLDFDEYGGDVLRSADKFLAFVSANPDWFDVYTVPESERVALGRERELVQYLQARPGRFVAGDIIVLFGWTPWDRRERHYHSFFVYETDPVTGFPLFIAGNAGRPTVRTWHTECLRTPRRYLIRRIRPRLEWLERIVDPKRGRDLVPRPVSNDTFAEALGTREAREGARWPSQRGGGHAPKKQASAGAAKRRSVAKPRPRNCNRNFWDTALAPPAILEGS